MTSINKLYIHLVFVTKYRKSVFTNKHLNFLHKTFSNICFKINANLIEFSGEKDHVHLLIKFPPSIAIASLVHRLKGASSRILRQNSRFIQNTFYKNVLWSPSYLIKVRMIVINMDKYMYIYPYLFIHRKK